jgi:hypothetical protein
METRAPTKKVLINKFSVISPRWYSDIYIIPMLESLPPLFSVANSFTSERQIFSLTCPTIMVNVPTRGSIKTHPIHI